VIVIEILGEIISRIFVEFIFHGIILGIYRLFKKAVEFIRVKVLGLKAKPINPQKALEKKLLYKIIELTENINPNLNVGLNGVILEVLDKSTVLTEFLDHDGKQIEFNNNSVFELKMDQFKLKR
jgi:hypothetical protein